MSHKVLLTENYELWSAAMVCHLKQTDTLVPRECFPMVPEHLSPQDKPYQPTLQTSIRRWLLNEKGNLFILQQRLVSD